MTSPKTAAKETRESTAADDVGANPHTYLFFFPSARSFLLLLITYKRHLQYIKNLLTLLCITLPAY